MAVTVKFYNSFATNVGQGNIILNTATFKLLLVTSSYTFNEDTHSNRSHITNEVVGTGYTAGGQTVTTTSWTQDNTNNRTIFDFDDVTWSNVTLTARAAVLYKSTGVAATDLLVLFWDFGADQSVAGADFLVALNSIGAFVMRQEPAF